MNETVRKWFHDRPAALKALRLFDSISRYYFIVSYVFLCLYTLAFKREKALRTLLIPAFTYGSGSVLRRLINEKRPYEKKNYIPLIERDGKGKSFPSRHAFSGAVIAMAFMWLCLPLGIVFLCSAICIGIVRVISGVHYIRDVAAGLLYGILCGLAGFFCNLKGRNKIG